MQGSSLLGSRVPSARNDAETAERTRWLMVLADLLRGTKTPMGKLLGEKPGSIQMLGGGLSASTTRARVRCARRFLAWLTMQYEISHPSSLQQVVDFMQTRLSEPCSRGALKSSHRGYCIPGRNFGNRRIQPHHPEPALLSHLQGVAHLCHAGKTDQTGPTHASYNDRSFGNHCSRLERTSLFQNLFMVVVAAELGHDALQRSQGNNPILGDLS